MRYMRVIAYVDAFQFDGDFMDSTGKYYVPQWAVDALNARKLYFECGDLYYVGRFGNRHEIKLNDFIVREESGEIWGISPEHFVRLYRRCNDESFG